MQESQQVLEWQAEARAEGIAKGKAEVLVTVLRAKWGGIPDELEESILKTTDVAVLDRWVDQALQATSLDEFRQAAHI